MNPHNSGNETNIKLPFSFIFFSIIALFFSQVIFFLHANEFASSHFRVPAILSAAHLFILGWMVSTAMGAMYQLVPVAFLTPIWSEKFGYAQFTIFSIGISSFSFFLYSSPQNALVPGMITLLGILMFFLQMVMTLKKQASPNILTAFITASLISLFVTIFIGISLMISWKTGWLSSSYTALFKTHLLLGIGGWFTLLIFGFSYKMVPMFSLAHGYSMKLAKYVLTIYLLGLLTAILAFFNDSNSLMKLGFLFLLSGFALFAWHIMTIIQKRIKKRLDKPFIFALSAIFFGLLIHALLLMGSFTPHFQGLIGALLFLYIMLWIVLSIMGYLYKIIPFLWWTHKYSKNVGKIAVPALKDMMNEKLAVCLLTIFIFACFIIYFGIILQLVLLIYLGIILFSLTIISIAISILLVLFK